MEVENKEGRIDVGAKRGGKSGVTATGRSVDRQREKNRSFSESTKGLERKENWKGMAERHIPKNRDKM